MGRWLGDLITCQSRNKKRDLRQDAISINERLNEFSEKLTSREGVSQMMVVVI
jgi:hypothetical protein